MVAVERARPAPIARSWLREPSGATSTCGTRRRTKSWPSLRGTPRWSWVFSSACGDIDNDGRMDLLAFAPDGNDARQECRRRNGTLATAVPAPLRQHTASHTTACRP
jgi:hypothetical protein